MNLLDLMVKIGVDDQTSSKLDSISTGAIAKATVIGNAFYDAAKFVAGKAVDMTKTIVGGAFSSYSSYEQLVGGVDKLYGDASGKLQQYAQQAYKTSGMSANQYMEQATSFSAALINSLGGDVDKAADQTDKAMRLMSDNINTFGSDAEAVQNAIQGLSRENYTMLDNLKLGYSGTSEGMENLIKDAEEYAQKVKDMDFETYAKSMEKTGLSAEELRKRYDELSSSTDLTMGNFSDMVDAIDIIQEKQNIWGTTSREAMTTIEGSVNATKAAWQNFLTAIGAGDQDLIRQSVGGLVEGIFGTFNEEVGKREGGLLSNVVPVVTRIGQAIVQEIPNLASLVGYKFAEMIAQAMGMDTGYEDSIDRLLHRIGVVMSYKLPDAIKGVLTDALSTVFGDAGAEAVENFFSAFDAQPFIDAFDMLKEAGSTLIDMFIENLPNIGTVLGVAATVVGDFAEAIASVAKVVVPLLPSIVAGLVAVKAVGIGTAIAGFVTTLISALGTIQTIGGAVSALVTIMGGPVTIIAAIVAAIVAFIATNEDAREAIKKAWTAAGKFMTETLSKIKKAVADGFEAMKNAVKEKIDLAVAVVKTAFNLIKQAISDAITAIRSNVSNGFTAVITTITGIASRILSAVRDAFNGAVNAVRTAMSSFTSAVADGVNGAVSWVLGLPSRLLGAIGDLSGDFWSIGYNAMAGMRNGINVGASSAIDAVVTSARSLVENAKAALQQNSPSKVFMRIGEGTMEGMELGIVRTTQDAVDAIDSAVGKMVNAANVAGSITADVGEVRLTAVTPSAPQNQAQPATSISASIGNLTVNGTDAIGQIVISLLSEMNRKGLMFAHDAATIERMTAYAY